MKARRRVLKGMNIGAILLIFLPFMQLCSYETKDSAQDAEPPILQQVQNDDATVLESIWVQLTFPESDELVATGFGIFLITLTTPFDDDITMSLPQILITLSVSLTFILLSHPAHSRKIIIPYLTTINTILVLLVPCVLLLNNQGMTNLKVGFWLYALLIATRGSLTFFRPWSNS